MGGAAGRRLRLALSVRATASFLAGFGVALVPWLLFRTGWIVTPDVVAWYAVVMAAPVLLAGWSWCWVAPRGLVDRPLACASAFAGATALYLRAMHLADDALVWSGVAVAAAMWTWWSLARPLA